MSMFFCLSETCAKAVELGERCRDLRTFRNRVPPVFRKYSALINNGFLRQLCMAEGRFVLYIHSINKKILKKKGRADLGPLKTNK